jgi:hypothetical protein
MTTDRMPPPSVLTAGALALAALLTVTPLSWAPVRLLVTLPVLLVLPGWVLVRAVYRPAELESVERWLLVMGLSVVSLICLGLILDLTGPGLSPVPWVAGLAILLAPMEAVATRRDRRRAPATGRLATRTRPAVRPPPITLAVIGTCVILAAGAIAWVGKSARSQVYPGFTQLWLIPSHGPAGRYDIGVRSVEHARANFALVLSRGQHLLATYRYDGLPPGETWKVQWNDTTGTTGSTDPAVVHVRLLRDGRPYRLVALSSACPLPNSEGVCTPTEVRAARVAARRVTSAAR